MSAVVLTPDLDGRFYAQRRLFRSDLGRVGRSKDLAASSRDSSVPHIYNPLLSNWSAAISNSTLWAYSAPADRETLISGTLAWLLDPVGDHQLNDQFLIAVMTMLGFSKPEQVAVVPEDSQDTDRRFDIAVYDGEVRHSVIEVKCKTFGTAEQLHRYNQAVPRVGRIAFGEWNFPDLSPTDRDRFPLARLVEVAQILSGILKHSKTQASYFLQSFAEHLRMEAEMFSGLRNYFIEENEDSLPEPPTTHRYSQRFCNQLYWRWFKERAEETRRDFARDLRIDSQLSGVWCAGCDQSVPQGQTFQCEALGLQLPGPFESWVHIELIGDGVLKADEDSVAGSIQLRIKGDNVGEHRRTLFAAFRDATPQLRENGFRLSKRRPSDTQRYYTALRKNLRLRDFRFSELNRAIELLP